MRTSGYKLQFQTREEDPFLMNIFQKQNSKLPVAPIDQGIYCFEQDGSRQKSKCATKSLLQEKHNPLNHQTAYFGQSISISTKSDPFVQSISNDDVLANNIRICLREQFPNSGQDRVSKFQQATQLFRTQFTGHLRPSAGSSEPQSI